MGYNYRTSRVTSNLKKALKKTIKASIKIRNHSLYGTLVEYDQHLNLVMYDAKELIYNWDGDLVEIKEFGNIVVRGDSIIYIDFKPEEPKVEKKEEKSTEVAGTEEKDELDEAKDSDSTEEKDAEKTADETVSGAE